MDITEIERIVSARYDRSDVISTVSLIGSRAKGHADEKSDYDFMILWDALPVDFGEHVYIDEFMLGTIDAQAVHYDVGWLNPLLQYFSSGGDISGEWGELGFEAYLAFVAEAQFLYGDKAALSTIQKALTYPEQYREKVMTSQLGRLNNAKIQWNKRKKRSNMLAVKSHYDFMDAALRIIYAKNRRFYSTIKWLENDVGAFPLSNELRDILIELACSREQFDSLCSSACAMMNDYCSIGDDSRE